MYLHNAFNDFPHIQLKGDMIFIAASHEAMTFTAAMFVRG